MREYTLVRSYRGREIAAHMTETEAGVIVSLLGGDKPHIGAVGILDPDGLASVTQFSAHKEGVLCERWIKAFSEQNIRPAVVTAGIHYDNLGAEGIRSVLELCDELLEDCLHNLTNTDTERNIDMSEEMKQCPGCGRHCDLSAPSCPRGEAYARGEVPAENDENHTHHGGHESHGEHEHYGHHGKPWHHGEHRNHGDHGGHEHGEGHPHGDRHGHAKDRNQTEES